MNRLHGLVACFIPRFLIIHVPLAIAKTQGVISLFLVWRLEFQKWLQVWLPSSHFFNGFWQASCPRQHCIHPCWYALWTGVIPSWAMRSLASFRRASLPALSCRLTSRLKKSHFSLSFGRYCDFLGTTLHVKMYPQSLGGMPPRFCWVAQVTFPAGEEKNNGLRNTLRILFFCNQIFQGIGHLFFWPGCGSNSCIHGLPLGQSPNCHGTLCNYLGHSGKIPLTSE